MGKATNFPFLGFLGRARRAHPNAPRNSWNERPFFPATPFPPFPNSGPLHPLRKLLFPNFRPSCCSRIPVYPWERSGAAPPHLGSSRAASEFRKNAGSLRDFGEILGKSMGKSGISIPSPAASVPCQNPWNCFVLGAEPGWNLPLEKEPLEKEPLGYSRRDIWDAIVVFLVENPSSGQVLSRFWKFFPWNSPLVPVIPRKPNCPGFFPPFFPEFSALIETTRITGIKECLWNFYFNKALEFRRFPAPSSPCSNRRRRLLWEFPGFGNAAP